ncbi:Fanconi anemia group J protein [Porites harrisoni]
MADSQTDNRFEYTISGVKVVFPCKAYPTQLSMMNMIIRGIERQQNSLLESPTGSGKSLALLCSCLAWQTAEYEKKAKLEEQMNEAAAVAAMEYEGDELCNWARGGPDISPPKEPGIIIKGDPTHYNNTTCSERNDIKDPQNTSVGFCTPIHQTTDPNECLDRETVTESPTDDDFQPAKKRFRTPGQQVVSSSKKRRVETPVGGLESEDNADYRPPEWRMELTRDRSVENESHSAINNTKEKCSGDCSDKINDKPDIIKVPKIFFGTRTHKQIAQISRELRKTEYKRVRMTILSSREHSCIHPVVSKGKNKNEECKKLLDGSVGTTCRYYQKVHTIRTQTSLNYHGLNQAWDIEDLVTLGAQIKACPYYAARELMKEADIIFCPYNYLIDPKIRYQLDINLKDQIIVLDEAHNVEDSAREAASLTLTAVDLQNTLDELDKLVHLQVLTENHRALHLMVGSFLRWIHESSSQLKERSFEQSSKVWSGREIVAAMEKQGITPATFKIYSEHFQFVMASAKDPNRQGMPSLSSHSASLLEGIFLVGGFMMGDNMKYISDYRCAILKTSVMVRNVEALPGGWRRSHSGMRKEWTHSLNFWCLNPAVIFSELGSQARCIILTSGTLSPMDTFSSELGVKFPIQLEANHVIANSQVWVGTLSTGPSGTAINASFHSAETFTFQDEVGKMVLNVCETVPHGVLCFFPSYNMLDKLSKRWQSTGLWSKLMDRKIIVSEPRGGDKSEFDDIMHQFYHAVRTSEDEESAELDSDDESNVDGGLFLAVCRGKVSEGLDFADNNARAVITIGIPFPNVKDIQVELKRKYNTQYAASRGLLTGSEWYEIQAYRALNQALGRCIRHKQDWGAILLIDERFNKSPKYTNGISKWVRKRISRFTDFAVAMSSLKEFASARKLEPCPSNTSPTLSQLSVSSVETPVKQEIVHVDRKPDVGHTPLRQTQLNRSGGFITEQNVHTGQLSRETLDTPTKEGSVHTTVKLAEVYTPLGRNQNSERYVHIDHFNKSTLETPNEILNGASTPASNISTFSSLSRKHSPLAIAQYPNGSTLTTSVTCNAQANAEAVSNSVITSAKNVNFKPNTAQVQTQNKVNVLFTPSQPPNSNPASVNPKVLVFKKGENVNQRKDFNGMTLVLDYNPSNGFTLTPVKCSELKTDAEVENQEPIRVANKDPESETLSEELLSSSPVLFTTPHSSPPSSPVQQESNQFEFSQTEKNTTDVNSSYRDLVRNKQSEKNLEKQNTFLGNDSVDSCKKEDEFNGPSLGKSENAFEAALANGGNFNEPSLTVKKEKPRDFLDDVKGNLMACQESSLQLVEPKVESGIQTNVLMSSRDGELASKENVSEVQTNVRQATRRSTRIRRSSNSSGNTKKTPQLTNKERKVDVVSGGPVLSCTRCGKNLIAGSFSSKPTLNEIPDRLRCFLDDKNVLVIDTAASCQALNLSPLVDLQKDLSPGFKLNSIFVPEKDCCFIPQICRVCQSANGDSRIVGLEVVSFKSSSEKEETGTLPLKQVWLFPSLVYVVNG